MKERITKSKNSNKVVIVNDQGTIVRERNFVGKNLDGPINIFYDDGSPKLQGNFKNNSRVGTWKHFNPEGKLILKETF